MNGGGMKQSSFPDSVMKRFAPNRRLIPEVHRVFEKMNLDPDPIKKMYQKVQVLPTPVKSESDRKEYKVIRLRNGLTACLISDLAGSVKEQKVPNPKMAAAALCVGVGSFSDPKEFPGLAHFLEHMVFMGSKKFPQENDFHSFLLRRCGYRNAYTNRETTTFSFKCLSSDLCEGLPRFAQFFISPLMSRSAINREREAVDSEFQQKLPNNLRRRTQLLLNLAKKDSPVKTTFASGNSKMLRDNVEDSDLYNALHEFRKRHYSAHRMTLAIQADLPIELLETYVLDYFSDVPCNNLPPDNLSKYKDCFDTPEWNRFYYIASTTHTDAVEITFALPPLLDKYKTKPLSYISWILGDEGEGSLVSYLRKKAWALSVPTAIVESCTLYLFFSIEIHLTMEGIENITKVIETVFSFINMMKTLGPQESIYNEMKQIGDISFRFAAEQSVYDYVKKIAESMQTHPPEHYLTGPDLLYDYDPEGINVVMNLLAPRKANLSVMIKPRLKDFNEHSFFAAQYCKTEKWFGTKYRIFEIAEEDLFRWENAKLSDEFALPLPNLFIAENFEIIPSSSDVRSEFPVKILENDAMELWHRKDEKFKLPMAFWYIKLVTQLPVKLTYEQTLLDFFIKLLMIQVAEEGWPAKKAKLTYEFGRSNNGISIKVRGLNEKLPMLISLLMKHLKSFTSHLNEKTFAAFRYDQIKTFYNLLLDVTTRSSDYYTKNLLFEKQDAIHRITLEDMKTFAEQFLGQLYVKVLVEGNVSAKEATFVAQNIVRDLNYSNYKPVNENSNTQHQTKEISLDKVLTFTVKSLNESDPNSIVRNVYLGNKWNMKTGMILDLTMLLIQGPLFDTLRTKEQLGYDVHCNVNHSSKFLAINVTVKSQAGKYSTRHVDERIDLFMKNMCKALKDISESEFEMVKRHLINKTRCQNYNLAQEVMENWREIGSDTQWFERLKQQAEHIKKTKLSELCDWWKEHVYCEEKDEFTYKKISVQVFGYGSQEDSTQESGAGEPIEWDEDRFVYAPFVNHEI